MKGLRTQEDPKFEKFFEKVQYEAKKMNCVFFLDCGQGDVFEDESFICEDMCGWMIPESKSDEFEKLFNDNSNEQHEFDDFYVFVDYTINDNGLQIDIDDTPNDLIVELAIKNEVLQK